MSDAKAKEKSKSKSKKAALIIISVLAVIIIAGIVIINILTMPVSDTSEKVVPVGGMLVSDEIDYRQKDSSVSESNLIIKIMQLVWKSCSASDAKVHKTQTPPDNIEEIQNIPYINDSNVYHLLDVYYPEGTTEKLPVIIDIHGGGWMYGDKDLNKNYCLSLASRGYVVFNMSYRLVPDVTVNEQLQDVAYALRWISENMNNYPCDPQSVMLTGDSAGGQLAVYSAVLMQNEQLRKTFDVVDGNIDLTALLLTSPVSFMNNGDLFSIYTKMLWGSDYKDKATYEYMNLDQIVDFAELPPTYLITSSGDSLAHSQTLKTAELLKKKNVPCQLADYGKIDGKKLAHVFSVLEPFDKAGKTAIDEALKFYQNAINDKAE